MFKKHNKINSKQENDYSTIKMASHTDYVPLPDAKTIDDVENAARNTLAKVGKQSEEDLKTVVPYINGAIVEQLSFSPEPKIFIQIEDIFRSLMVVPTNNLLYHILGYYNDLRFVRFSTSEYTKEFGYSLIINLDVDYLAKKEK